MEKSKRRNRIIFTGNIVCNKIINLFVFDNVFFNVVGDNQKALC